MDIPTTDKTILHLTRRWHSDECIIGQMHISGFCDVNKPAVRPFDTLELPWRNNKRNESCIEPGFYKFEWKDYGTFAELYGRRYGHDGVGVLRGVRKRSEILIHIGNTAKDTAGCILVGKRSPTSHNSIGSSVNTYKRFYKAIKEYHPTHILITQEIMPA